MASGYTRIRGRVIDPSTGQGVAGVCLVPGSLECDAYKPYSDANGYFAIDVTTGAYWDIRFQATGYRVARIRVYAGGTEINVVQEGVPEAIPVEMCYLGWQESLAQLGRLVEPEIPA